MGGNGDILIGNNDHRLYCVSPYGELKWKLYIGAPIDGGVSINSQGIIMVGSLNSHIYAIGSDRIPTNQPTFTWNPTSSPTASPREHSKSGTRMRYWLFIPIFVVLLICCWIAVHCSTCNRGRSAAVGPISFIELENVSQDDLPVGGVTNLNINYPLTVAMPTSTTAAVTRDATSRGVIHANDGVGAYNVNAVVVSTDEAMIHIASDVGRCHDSVAVPTAIPV